MRAVPVRKAVTSSWAAPAAVAPYRAAASGQGPQGHRARWPFNHDRTHRRSDSPEHWHVLAVPVTIRKTSSWAAPAAVHSSWPLPQDSATGQAGHYTVCSHWHSPGQDWIHQSTGTCWQSQSQSERLQIGLPLQLLHRSEQLPLDRATGQEDHYTVF